MHAKRLTTLLSTTAAGLLTVGLTGTAPAYADYGKDALYQVELSVNIAGPQGGGVWLWYELDSDGTGDYQGSDCGHGGEGAAHDAGDVTWTYTPDHSHVVISGTVLAGLGGYATTVTIPSSYGHQRGTDETFMTLPGFIPSGIGDAELQVAP